MSIWEAIGLGALQGVTEFLPISSTGHLVLAHHYLGFEKDDSATNLFFDGVLHLGTALAVLLYYRRGLKQQLTQHLGGACGAERVWPEKRRDLTTLGWLVALATLPAVLTVLFLSEEIKDSFNNPRGVAINFLALGAILVGIGFARSGATVGPATRWWQALAVGCGQALSAVFRGLSRSGMTISCALLVGLERNWAVRFSFLLSVVASAGLGGLGIFKGIRDPQASQWLTGEFLTLTVLATAVSAVVGYLTIDPLIRLVRRARLWWFALYLWTVAACVLLGG